MSERLWDGRGWVVVKKATGGIVLCGGSPVVYRTREEADTARLWKNEKVLCVRHIIERTEKARRM